MTRITLKSGRGGSQGMEAGEERCCHQEEWSPYRRGDCFGLEEHQPSQ